VLLGHHATVSLAAFALAMAVYGPVVAAVTGVLRGVMPFVPELGPGPVVGGALWLSYGIGLAGALTVAAIPLIGSATGVARPVLDHLGPLPPALAVAVLAQSVGASASSTLVMLGRSRTVLRCGLIGTAAAVLLSITAVPRLGAEGAGLAILTATLAYAVQVQLALRRATGLRRTVVPGPFDRRLIVRLAATGLPMAGTVLVKFVVLGVLTFAAARLGTGPAAVHGVAETLVNLIYAVAVTVGQSVVPLIARAPAPSDVRRSLRAGVLLAGTVVGVLALALVLFGRWILPLFTADPAVRSALGTLLPLVALVVVADAVQAVYGFGMLGLRTTLPSLISTALVFGALCLAAVPIADAGGLPALWSALAAANSLQAVTKAALFTRRAARLPAKAAG
jgi:MATE family multidrug resistance protein